MKKNILSLTFLSGPIEAANDDGLSVSARSAADASLRSPASERTGWDPFEVWRTRIRLQTRRDERRDH